MNTIQIILTQIGAGLFQRKFVRGHLFFQRNNCMSNCDRESHDVPARLKVQIACMNNNDGTTRAISFLVPKKDVLTNEWRETGRKMNTFPPFLSKGYIPPTFSLTGGPLLSSPMSSLRSTSSNSNGENTLPE
mmetsp:Transcript_30894/g.45407  ORF Transcript_30894/g.45407 Transcript_30894/m.45407 type:complete len:132 (+) Transcript_30894:262-657(+)